MDTFSTVVTQMDPQTVKLDLAGRLDRQAVGELLRVVRQMGKNRTARILVDFTALDPLTGDGLQTACVLLAAVRGQFGSLWVRGLNAETRRGFELAHLDRIAREFPEPDQTGQPLERPQAITDLSTLWSQPMKQASYEDAPPQAVNLNVHRRELTSPADSFGRLWLRTYRVQLCGNPPPEEVMARWRERFGDFWPPGNLILPSGGRFDPGTACLINLAFPLGMTLSTGAVVIHADPVSFTLMTLQGHMFSGLITFSSYREGENTYAQTQALVRPNDPMYELVFRLGYGPKTEDAFWIRAMRNVATHFNIGSELRCPMDEQRKVETGSMLIDSKMQWRHFGNLWYNAAIRSAIDQVVRPIRRRLKPHRTPPGRQA